MKSSGNTEYKILYEVVGYTDSGARFTRHYIAESTGEIEDYLLNSGKFHPVRNVRSIFSIEALHPVVVVE